MTWWHLWTLDDPKTYSAEVKKLDSWIRTDGSGILVIRDDCGIFESIWIGMPWSLNKKYLWANSEIFRDVFVFKRLKTCACSICKEFFETGPPLKKKNIWVCHKWKLPWHPIMIRWFRIVWVDLVFDLTYQTSEGGMNYSSKFFKFLYLHSSKRSFGEMNHLFQQEMEHRLIRLKSTMLRLVADSSHCRAL